MKRLPKTLVNFALIALMSAVVLRPVVVQASSDSHPGEAGQTHLRATFHQGVQGHGSAIRLSKTQVLSKLKVIPKEVVDFEALTPRFADFSLPLSAPLQVAVSSQIIGFSASKPLVLRI